MKKFFQKTIVKNILSALAVLIFGFILLNITFILDAVYQGIIRGIIGLFIPLGPEIEIFWFPPLMHLSFVVVIAVISWLIFRSKLKIIYKAIYMTVPAAVVLVTLGMFLSNWPAVSYMAGALACASAIYFFYRAKQPWLYYYAVILVAVALVIMNITGTDI